MNSLNIELFRLINDAHNAVGDAVFGVVSGLGDGLIVALACSLLILFRLRLGMASLAAFAVSGLITLMLKHIFDAPRPPAVLDHVHVLGQALQSHSFPSGHATSDGVMVAASFLLWAVRDWRAWAVAGLFALAAYGRVYGGVHFPLDVVAGLAIGAVVMWGLWKWSENWAVEHWGESPWAWKIPGLAVAIEAGVLGLGYPIQPATARPFTWVLAVGSLICLMGVWRQKSGH